MAKTMKFPKGFVWGAATAAYQNEGGWKADGKGPSIWDTFSHIPGKTFNNDNGDISCDSYHHYKDDVAAMKWAGMNAYRFSISWPRVMPAGRGRVNAKGLAYYDRLIDECLKAGLEPFVTMYHWDLPQALENKGGWRKKATALAFHDYAVELVKRYSDRVRNWMPINEAPIFVHAGYKAGIHAPGAKESWKVVNQCAHNSLLAHGLGVRAVRAYAKQKSETGIAHPVFASPASRSAADMKAVELWYQSDFLGGQFLWPMCNGGYHKAFLKRAGKDAPDFTDEDMEVIATKNDFLGVNVYFGPIIAADGKGGYKEVPPPDDVQRTSMHWPVLPDCMYWAVKLSEKLFNVDKLYVTENGASFVDTILHDGKIHDLERVKFFRSYLRALHRAMQEGAPVKGYFVWTLCDNFDWNSGYGDKLGIFYTDMVTGNRQPKESARFFRETIKKNRLG